MTWMWKHVRCNQEVCQSSISRLTELFLVFNGCDAGAAYYLTGGEAKDFW